MEPLLAGALAGAAFGALAVALMVPLKFEDKRRAMLAAFLNRFGIGVVIAVATLPLPGWAAGLTLGLLLSLPDALITKAYAPILGVGAAGGAVLGFVLH